MSISSILSFIKINPSSGSGEVENVNCLTNEGQTTDEQTPDNGAFASCALKNQSIFSIKHSVLWLLANYAWMGRPQWQVGKLHYTWAVLQLTIKCKSQCNYFINTKFKLIYVKGWYILKTKPFEIFSLYMWRSIRCAGRPKIRLPRYRGETIRVFTIWYVSQYRAYDTICIAICFIHVHVLQKSERTY